MNQNIPDREYIGWSQEILSQWEEGIYVLPMWYRSVHLPSHMWLLYFAMLELRKNVQNNDKC